MIDMLTVNDCRKAGYCASGIRRRCRELNLDDRKFFLEGGLPIDELRHFDDVAIQRSIAEAEKRIAQKDE